MSDRRRSNLELLRIVSMMLIVAAHYSSHGGWPPREALTANRLFIDFLGFGYVGVNCFVLITGYFMVESRFKSRSALRIWFATFFYSVLFLVIALGAGWSPGLGDVVKSLLPVIASNYWFITAYLALYFLAPFLNVLVSAMSAETYGRLLVLLLIGLSVIPTLLPVDFVFSRLAWFVFLYLLAGYVRTVEPRFADHPRQLIAIAALSAGLILVSIAVLDYLGRYAAIFAEHSGYFDEMNRLLVLICSVALFLYFRNLEIGQIRWINAVAATTLGVYLIHDNPLFRPVLWERLAMNARFYTSDLLFAHALITIVAVFVACSAIEMVRMRVVEGPLFAVLEKRFADRFDRVDRWMNPI